MQDGVIVPILEKTRFNFSYLTTTTPELVRIQREIDVIPFYRVQLIVRVHALALSAGQSFGFALDNTLPCEDDPREFSATTSFLSFNVTSASGAPPLLISASGTNPGPFLKFTISATQSATGGTALYGEFSAVLLLRTE